MPAIAGGATSTQNINLVADVSGADHWYGACVDEVNGEISTLDNCSTSTKVDSIISSATLSAAATTVASGSSVNGTITAVGQSNYYKIVVTSATEHLAMSTSGSTDTAAILYGSSGTSIRTDNNSGSGNNFAISYNATKGTYYLRVYESGNNATGNYSLTVGNFDFTVDKPTVTGVTLPASVALAPGRPFTLNATVRNAGNIASPTTTLRYRRSSDSAITASDTQIGTDTVPSVAASGSSAQNTSLVADPGGGAIYYGACADSVALESSNSNNCSSGLQVNSSITAATLGAAATTISENDFTNASISKNSESHYYKIVISEAGTLVLKTVNLTGGGNHIDSAAILYDSSGAQLVSDDNSGAGTHFQISYTVTSSSGGTYYLRVYESGNNATGNYRLGSSFAAGSPNLQVKNPNIGGLTTLTVAPGKKQPLRVRVENVGKTSSPVPTLKIYRSTDTTISTADTVLKTVTINNPIVAGGSLDQTIEVIPHSTVNNTVYIGACVDSVAGGERHQR